MLGNGSVLVIDDETAITSSLEAILSDEGYKVYCTDVPLSLQSRIDNRIIIGTPEEEVCWIDL